MTDPSAKSFAPRVPKRWLGILGAASLLLATQDALAQGWLADRRYAEGAGIKTGDLELHPGIGGEVGYDSNWFQRSNAEGPNVVNGAPNLPPRDAAVFRITPSFYVSTLGAQRLTDTGAPQPRSRLLVFRGGVSATARFFIGKEMSDQHNVSLNADARLDINQGQFIGFGVFGVYSRLIQPQVTADPNVAFNRDDIRLGGEAIMIPGGGTFDLRAGYQFLGSFYEESNGAPFSSTTHEVYLKDRWKFRPRTALFSEAALGFVNYPSASRASFLLNDSTPLRTRIGVTGLVTNWFGLLAAAGYSATFFKDPEAPSSIQYNSINAQAEATFYLGGNNAQDLPGEATLLLSSLSFGFSRDFQRSLVGNFYTANRVYSKLQYWFGGRVLADLHIAGEQDLYPQVFYNPTTLPPTPEYTNYRVFGGIFAEYRFSQAFGLNTTIDYMRQFSDQTLPAASVAGSTTPGVWDQNYGRLQAFLGFRYFY